METMTTNGITIIVETFYQAEHSRPLEQKFIFAYRVTIENHSPDTVQLLRRHWFIFDSSGLKREVEGEGVVGLQPVLEPNESHQYTSWCPLMTELGKMYGAFLMKKSSGALFDARIPEFRLVAPQKMN
ncbi:MAG: Co2+/Mg2+ efflux protein ApaG [Saprospirales bacterium]|jgi:ApaG protein|nr:Co2+/Mg2+ efflux protein ApaG [Saprospirales bacterium]MBK6903186.1 Co2+/Mg2+ efflux protein ApaG [Saprospirales bacterium]MBK7334737.1 Co2+/Mg2+ efflux protein ApaG [Saprospirales bacterium]